MPNASWLLTQPVMTSASFVRRTERRNTGRRTSNGARLRPRTLQELGAGCYRAMARPQSA
jgi:hypothetical protein